CFFPSRSPPPLYFPLFPYTTLFRSRPSRGLCMTLQVVRFSSWVRTAFIIEPAFRFLFCFGVVMLRGQTCCRHRTHLHRVYRGCRSEEHTSELQSLRHLVCRLLLEKK